MQAYAVLLLGLFLFCACNGKTLPTERVDVSAKTVDLREEELLSYVDSMALRFAEAPAYVTDGFDYPVGKPDAKYYYNAQSFGENTHLGDDWNGIGGGNTDLGDPIYAVANGYVVFAQDIGGGWGQVIRIIHQLPSGELVESISAHCDTMLVTNDEFVRKGQPIATIGNCDGAYLAHLHFELRTDVELPIGPGYSMDTLGYTNPAIFIAQHRK